MLSGHTDVVPTEGQAWSLGSVHAYAKADGRLYARGSADMKGFLACCLTMLRTSRESRLARPHRTWPSATMRKSAASVSGG